MVIGGRELWGTPHALLTLYKPGKAHPFLFKPLIFKHKRPKKTLLAFEIISKKLFLKVGKKNDLSTKILKLWKLKRLIEKIKNMSIRP